MTTETIEATLCDLDMPQVESWQVEAGPDATGDDAVWVWVTLRDEDVDAATRAELRRRIRTALGHAVDESAPWVYVRFRTAAEMETH